MKQTISNSDDIIDSRDVIMKNPTTHTPGPWKVGGTFNAIGDVLRMVKTDDWRMVSVAYCPRVVGDDCAEQDANAHLIAAAPDLLAALKALRAAEEFIDAAYYEAYAEASALAVAAIARAEGRG